MMSDENGESQPSVRDDAVDLLGRIHPLARNLDGRRHQADDGIVALGGDDALGIVILFGLDTLADGVDRCDVGSGELQTRDGALLAFE